MLCLPAKMQKFPLQTAYGPCLGSLDMIRIVFLKRLNQLCPGTPPFQARFSLEIFVFLLGIRY
jgi:hypothetical protein